MSDIYDTISTREELKLLFNHTSSYEKPNQTLTVVDTFENIGGANVGDANVGTYVIQNLIPGTTYTLTFNIEREIDNVWTDVTAGDSLNPAVVIGAGDTSSTTNFWWSSTDSLNRQLRFKTIQNDGTSSSSTGFTQTRKSITPFQPQNTRLIDFTSNATYYTLSSDGRPSFGAVVNDFGGPNSDLGVSIHAFDAFLFFFEIPDIRPSPAELNTYLTAGFRFRNDYVGYNATNATKGFLKIPNVHLADGNGVDVDLSDGKFTSSGVFGGPLDRNKQYYAAFMFVNKTAKYIPSRIDDNSDLVIQWSVFEVPFGGVWSISLKNFKAVSDVDGQLSQSTTVAVEIDGIGTQGVISSTDNFRITMTATPFV